MAQIINTNISSLNSQRNLMTSQGQLSTSLQRLSSGLRINSAKDDAAGLAISERMTTQVRGLNQAARNANDAISLAQTTEGALNEMSNALQRIRELAVQAANATNNSSDRAALDAEVRQLVSEVDRISRQTNFNGNRVLDGSFSAQRFQVGANPNEGITVDSIGSKRANSLGQFNGVRIENLELTPTSTPFGSIIINGEAYSVFLGLLAPNANLGPDGATIAAQINGTYSHNGEAPITRFPPGLSATARPTVQSAVETGTAVNGSLTYSILGIDVTLSASVSAGKQGNRAAAVSAINSNQLLQERGIYARDTGTGVEVVARDGRLLITNASNATGGASASTFGLNTGITRSRIDITYVNPAGAPSGTVQLNISGTDPITNQIRQTGDTLDKINVRTNKNATEAIIAADAALQRVNDSRALLGAVQSRFSSTIANLQSSAENLSAARSRIMDTDFAAETAKLARAQILQQAGVAMVAQANVLPQNVLSLLR